MNAAENILPDRSLLPRGLRRLILLRYKARLRRMFLGSGKRRIYTIVGLGLMALYLLPRILTRASQRPFDPEAVRIWLPAVLLLILVPQIIFRTRRDPTSFLPAELDLVVPGPFSRRQLVLYQIVYQVGPLIIMGLWFGAFFRAGGSYLATALAVSLFGQFVMLLSCVCTALAGLLVARSRYLLPVLIAAVGLLIIAVIRQAPAFPGADPAAFREWALAVRQTPSIRALCLPLRPCTEALIAPSLLAAAPWFGAGLLINITLIAVFITLDRGEVEALVANSQRRLEHAQRSRRGSIHIANPRRAAARRIPMPPRWAGIGPLLWRQLTTLYRGGGPLAILLLALLILSIPFWFRHALPIDKMPPLMALLAGATTFLLSMFIRCDFRADLDHLATLKSLPLSPLAIVLGQLAAPALIIAGVNALLLTGLVGAAGNPAGALPAALMLLGTIPLAGALLAIENIIFLIAPIRPYAQAMAAGFDPSLMGRHFLVTLVKLSAFAVAALIIGGPTLLALHLGAGPLPATLIALAGALALLTALLYACTTAFKAFDAAEDQPG